MLTDEERVRADVLAETVRRTVRAMGVTMDRYEDETYSQQEMMGIVYVEAKKITVLFEGKAEELKKKETSILEMAIRLKVARKNRRTWIERAHRMYEKERKAMVDENEETFREAYTLVRREEQEEEER